MDASRPYHHQDLKRELLLISRQLLAESGLEAFSVAKAAKRAGVSNAAPYRHFADSDDLLAAVASDIGRLLVEALADAVRDAPADPVQRLAATAGAYTSFVIKNGVGLELVFAKRFSGPRFEAVHAQGRRIMDILLPLAHQASPSNNWTASLQLLESHISLAFGFAAQQLNGALSARGLSTGELARHANEAAIDLIKGFQLRYMEQPAT